MHVAPAMASFLTIIAAAGMAASMAGLPPAPTLSADGSSGPGGSALPGATSPVEGGTGSSPASSLPASSSPPATSSPAPSAPPEGWTALELPPLPRVARLEPTRSVPAGVLADTAFRLTALDGSDPAALARTLVADPPLELRVSRSDATVAVVEPAAPLRAGTRYELALRDPDGTVRGAWSVQAVQPLSVVATVPRDESTRVPLDTGIEVTFDQDGVALGDARKFISIAPPVEGTWVQEGRTVAFVPAAALPTGTLYTVTVRHGLPLAGTSMTLEQDVIVRFETDDEAAPNTWVTLRRGLYDTGTAEGAVIGVNMDEPEEEESEGRDRPNEVAVTLHELRNVDAAVDAWDEIRRAPGWTLVSGTAPVATDGLPVALESTLPLRRIEPERNDRLWFRLPAMPAGWYVLTMQERGVPRQAVVQVTDLAVYATVTATRTLAWVNDLATKAPL
ncbi:MAG TPA: Ig-like domain-containing protein, partial [Candidatus Limnocylindrales bacterium]|nr:Ig-like domain-containing protein [Candidatus Limnocylindrales bacterium]